MNYEDKINILPYIFVVFILSSYIVTISYKSKWLAILFVSCFFIALIFTIRPNVAIILILFFLVPIMNNFYYNNIKIGAKEEIRILSVNPYGGIGEISRRKVYLSGNIKNIKLGERFIANGKFSKEPNIEKGIIGEFEIYNLKKLTVDFKERLYRLRENIYNSLSEKLGYRRSAIITSISFGYTEFLDLEDKENMKSLGVLHAISVSGLHMVLVYTMLKKVFGEKITPIISLIYVIFTGAALSTVRAYIMMLCVSFATPLRRNYNPLASLSLAGIILMLITPYSTSEVGFQLSFLATLGIILFNKKINKALYKLPKFFREGIAICISSQIFTFPVLALSFREFSFGFLFGNLIIVPLMNALVILGNLLALLVNFKAIFNYLAFIAYYITVFIDELTELLLKITPNAMYVSEIISIGYIIMLITIYFYKKGYKRFIYFPSILILYFYFMVYTPLPKIEYFKEGIIAVSYKGERTICAIKKNVNLEKYKIITLSQNVYKDFNSISLGRDFKILKINKNIILKGKNKNYLIDLGKEKSSYNYDIIDFKSNNYNKIILFKDKVLVFN